MLETRRLELQSQMDAALAANDKPRADIDSFLDAIPTEG